ncbi:MAG: hypothetical protein ABI615_02010 [Chthoniobacterales bacterium]
MKTLEEKQIEVDLFLRNDEKTALSKLEKTISGKLSFLDFTGPCVITFLLLGFVYLEHLQSENFSLGSLSIFILITTFWLIAISNNHQKQVSALKKYFDLKLTELEKKK